VRTSSTEPDHPDVLLLRCPENLVHRSIASILAAALVLSIPVLSASAAEAHHRSKPKTVAVTLKTDAMPTRVRVTSVSGRVTCVRVVAGSGRDRRVWLTLDGRKDVTAYRRLGARRSSKCLLTGALAPRGSRLAIRVVEDLPGPFDPRATAALRL
jgi:hypothetical protein